jgi:hypothetical protein
LQGKVVEEDFTPTSRALTIMLDEASLKSIPSGGVAKFMCNLYNDADSYKVVWEAGKVSRLPRIPILQVSPSCLKSA